MAESQQSLSMWMVVASLRRKWPRVTSVTTCTLGQWIRDWGVSQPTPAETKSDNKLQDGLVILDCRPEEEYKVSHIEGAVRVNPDLSDMPSTLQHIESVADGKEEVKVVCYCSLGYRSMKYADAIQTELSKCETDERLASKVKAFNLEGSIFQWANEKRPMVDYVNQPTIFAHPYHIVWGKLLHKDLRRYDTKY